MKANLTPLINFIILLKLCTPMRMVKIPKSYASTVCTSSDDMSYHSSPTANTTGILLTGNVNIYNIFLGYSDDDYKLPYLKNKAKSTVGILEAFASSVSGTDYANIMKTYNAATHYTFKGNAFYNIPTNITSLSQAVVEVYVLDAIKQMSWSVNRNSVVGVIFRGDLNFGTLNSVWNKDWCGFHSAFQKVGPMFKIPIMIMGDEEFASSSSQPGCMLQYFSSNSIKYVSDVHPKAFNSPNQNSYGDAVTSTYAHELMEAASNINGRGWYRNCDGYENADACVWTFDRIYQSYDGTHYNVKFGDNKFLIQANWAYRPHSISGCVVNASALPQQYTSYAQLTRIKEGPTMEQLVGYGAAGIVGAALLLFIIFRYCFPVKTKSKETSLAAIYPSLHHNPVNDQNQNFNLEYEHNPHLTRNMVRQHDSGHSISNQNVRVPIAPIIITKTPSALNHSSDVTSNNDHTQTRYQFQQEMI